MTEVRILVADDFEPWRSFVASSFHEEPQLQIVCEAADGEQAVQKAKELRPDLILLDIGLPRLSGIAAARQIRALVPESRILFLSQETSAFIVEEALRLGASGYIVKSDAGHELVPGVNAVLRGERFVGGRFAGHDFTQVGDASVSMGASRVDTDLAAA